jgi:hypothetical protein
VGVLDWFLVGLTPQPMLDHTFLFQVSVHIQIRESTQELFHLIMCDILATMQRSKGRLFPLRVA